MCFFKIYYLHKKSLTTAVESFQDFAPLPSSFFLRRKFPGRIKLLCLLNLYPRIPISLPAVREMTLCGSCLLQIKEYPIPPCKSEEKFVFHKNIGIKQTKLSHQKNEPSQQWGRGDWEPQRDTQSQSKLPFPPVSAGVLQKRSESHVSWVILI